MHRLCLRVGPGTSFDPKMPRPALSSTNIWLPSSLLTVSAKTPAAHSSHTGLDSLVSAAWTITQSLDWAAPVFELLSITKCGILLFQHAAVFGPCRALPAAGSCSSSSTVCALPPAAKLPTTGVASPISVAWTTAQLLDLAALVFSLLSISLGTESFDLALSHNRRLASGIRFQVHL